MATSIAFPVQDRLAESCPPALRDSLKKFANYRCQHAVLATPDHRLVLVSDGGVITVKQTLPTYGKVFRITEALHERLRISRDITHIWVCNVVDDLTIDRYYPGALGGAYSIRNGGVLCRPCNAMKGDAWPWFDYRNCWVEFIAERERLYKQATAQLTFFPNKAFHRHKPQLWQKGGKPFAAKGIG